MDLALKLQTDVKNNAEDVHRYMLEMDNWEEQMKQKEMKLKNDLNKVSDLPPPRNRIKRNNSEKHEDRKKCLEKEKKSKIRAYDYAAWDKYDADKAYAEIDEEKNVEEPEDSEEQEEIMKEKEKDEIAKDKISLKNIDEAFYEKELGNTLVRKEKWEDAIKCYTRAIDLDSKNPIYYANRALCFIKKKNFKSAEVDATIAIQLDNTYIKAFQRRASARSALGQIQEAKSDYEEILKLDPKSSFAQQEINKLEKLINVNLKKTAPIFDPKCIFKNEPKKKCETSLKKNITTITGKNNLKKEDNKFEMHDIKSDNKETETEMKVNVAEEPKKNSGIDKNKILPVDELDVKPINSSFSQKSTETSDVFGEVPDGFKIIQPIHIPPHLRSKKPLRNIPVKEVFSNSETFDDMMNLIDDSSFNEKESSDNLDPQDEKVRVIEEKPINFDNVDFPVPETCVQFHQTWKLIKCNFRNCYSYLKKINPRYLFKIFKHSLESDTFSEMILTLTQDEALADSEFIYSFLYHLSNVNRFGSLVLFMSSSDKENLIKCFTVLEEKKSREEVEELRNLYELKEI